MPESLTHLASWGLLRAESEQQPQLSAPEPRCALCTLPLVFRVLQIQSFMAGHVKDDSALDSLIAIENPEFSFSVRIASKQTSKHSLAPCGFKKKKRIFGAHTLLCWQVSHQQVPRHPGTMRLGMILTIVLDGTAIWATSLPQQNFTET